MSRKPQKLQRDFYCQPADQLAPALLGKILVRRLEDQLLRARIVETEAYMGPEDLAAHSSKGRTPRTEVMFGPAGHAYVFFIYGMYEMFNIVAAGNGEGQAILVRAAEALDGWDANLCGPGRLARAMGITRALHNGIDLTGEQLFVQDNPADHPRIVTGPRIGVDYAKHWKDVPLRFAVADSPAVSKPRPEGWVGKPVRGRARAN